MDDVILYWLDQGVSGFRVDAVNFLFEDPELKDEPLSGKTEDSKSYDYTNHIHTRDLVDCLHLNFLTLSKFISFFLARSL